MGRGELTIADYEDLCARVWDAAHDDDSDELDAIAGRLERLESAREPESPAAPVRRGGGTSPTPVDGAALVGATPAADRQSGTSAVLSDKKLTGRWAPMVETTWWSFFGDVKLDLREADWPAERIVLDFQSALSDVTIIVPPGTAIVDDTTGILGAVKIKTSANAPANGLTVVLDGVLMGSDVKVRDH